MKAGDDLSLRFRLRRATAALHSRLEDVIAIEDRSRDLEGYRALLAMFWGFYAPMERALLQVDWRGSGLDFPARAKLSWLEQDLAVLGGSAATIAALPQASLSTAFDDLPRGLGALYVLEGSTLGGQTIVPVIGRALGFDAETGARFFSSYGPEVGRMWRDYVSVLDRSGRDPETAARIESAALNAFENLIAWCEACFAAPAFVGARYAH